MIAIYEPLYLPGQSIAEPSFRPLHLTTNTCADWREFWIIVDMYRRGVHHENTFTGVFSPKFGLKSGITGDDFIAFVEANTDADVCFINPFPHIAYYSYNVWMQGECVHPGLTALAQSLLDASGVDFKISDVPRQSYSSLCYCNFWVGTDRFWEDYVGGWLIPIAEFLERHPTAPAARDVLTITRHTTAAPFLPFITERLFSCYLSRSGNRRVYRAYPMDPLRSCLSEFDRAIVSAVRKEVDRADTNKVFPNNLRQQMALNCRLIHLYETEYYSHRPHPHSGMPLPTPP